MDWSIAVSNLGLGRSLFSVIQVKLGFGTFPCENLCRDIIRIVPVKGCLFKLLLKYWAPSTVQSLTAFSSCLITIFPLPSSSACLMWSTAFWKEGLSGSHRRTGPVTEGPVVDSGWHYCRKRQREEHRPWLRRNSRCELCWDPVNPLVITDPRYPCSSTQFFGMKDRKKAVWVCSPWAELRISWINNNHSWLLLRPGWPDSHQRSLKDAGFL